MNRELDISSAVEHLKHYCMGVKECNECLLNPEYKGCPLNSSPNTWKVVGFDYDGLPEEVIERGRRIDQISRYVEKINQLIPKVSPNYEIKINGNGIDIENEYNSFHIEPKQNAKCSLNIEQKQKEQK